MTEWESRATVMLCLGTAHLYYLTTNGEIHCYRYKGRLLNIEVLISKLVLTFPLIFVSVVT